MILLYNKPYASTPVSSKSNKTHKQDIIVKEKVANGMTVWEC